MDNESENKKYYNLRETRIKEINLELWNMISKYLPDLEIKFKERFYLMENNILKIPKCECGNSVKFIDMQRGYREFCSRKCMVNSDRVKNSRKSTNLEKFGVENPSSNPDIRKKIEESNLKKFGERYPLMSKDVLNKTREKFQLKWGVDNPSKLKWVREKAEKTNLEKWGNITPSKTEEVKRVVRELFLKNLGVDNPSKLKCVREKAKKTMLNLYGVEFPLQNREFLEKMISTNLEKWGTEYAIQNPEIKEKIKSKNLQKWGYEFSSQNPEIKKKIGQKNKESYNKSKISNSNIEKYGRGHISKTEEYRKRYKISCDPNYIEYMDMGISKFKCDNGIDHQFEIHIDNYYSRIGRKIQICTICNPVGDSKSITESEIYQFIKSIYSGEIIRSWRDGLEIDIYLPEIGIGFEYNGLYWHSELFKDKKYHKEKSDFFREKEIRIINIWEDDWIFRNGIIKSQIRNWIGSEIIKEYARNCEIKVIDDNKIIRNFLENNHIQGYSSPKLSIGLLRGDDILSIMTFDKLEGRKRMLEGEWNLSRFCNKLNTVVIGGASKILNYFIKNYVPTRIISYSDSSWSRGDLYLKMGFELVNEIEPDYKYIINGRRYHKSNFTKRKLGIQNDETESESSKRNGLIRIWDCGKKKFEKKI